MAITNSGKDFLYAEQSGSATHIKHSVPSLTVTLVASGTTTITLTQPSPAFLVGEQVRLRDATKTAYAYVTASAVGTVTIQPYTSASNSGWPASTSFTSATLESVSETPTRAATLTIDLTDAPVGASYTYIILGTANIGQSSAANVSLAWLRAQATVADPYAGTPDIGKMRATHTGSATHNFVASRRVTLSAGSTYLFQVEFASDTTGGTTTAQYAALCAIRYTSVYAATTDDNGVNATDLTSTTNSNTPAYTSARALATNIQAGTYLLVATGAVGTNNITDDTVCRLTTATAVAEGRFKFDNVNDYYPFSYIGVKTFTGTNAIVLQLARAGTTSTARLRNVQLCAIPLPAWIASTASSDFTGVNASITAQVPNFFNTIKQSASVSLSQGFHLEVVSAGVAATTASAIGPVWNDTAAPIFGTRYQGASYTTAQTYATSWFRGRTRAPGATTNVLVSVPAFSNTSVASNPQFFWLRQATFPDPGLESKPLSAALGNTNFLRTATIASRTSEATYYPARYLLSDHRTRRWRSTSSSTAQSISFDLGSARVPTMLALIDYNGTTGIVTLQSSTNSSFSSDLQTYSLWTDQQSPYSRTLCFYPGTDNWGAAPTARQFWRLTLPAGATADAYHELGGVWLGTYEPFAVVSSLSIDSQDDSPTAESRAGARYVDQFRPIAKVSLSVEYLGLASAQALRDRLLGLRQDPVVIDVHAVSAASGLYPYGRFFGYLDPGGISADLQGGNENTISLSFVESRG
jgi:hypothetical protein